MKGALELSRLIQKRNCASAMRQNVMWLPVQHSASLVRPLLRQGTHVASVPPTPASAVPRHPLTHHHFHSHLYEGVISAYADNRLDAALMRDCHNEVAVLCAQHPARALDCLQVGGGIGPCQQHAVCMRNRGRRQVRRPKTGG